MVAAASHQRAAGAGDGRKRLDALRHRRLAHPQRAGGGRATPSPRSGAGSRPLFRRETFAGIDRTDDTFGGYAEVAYDLNRNVALVGRYEHERLVTDDPCDCATENVVSLRVRLKR
jgi:hypothetical protein